MERRKTIGRLKSICIIRERYYRSNNLTDAINKVLKTFPFRFLKNESLVSISSVTLGLVRMLCTQKHRCDSRGRKLTSVAESFPVDKRRLPPSSWKDPRESSQTTGATDLSIVPSPYIKYLDRTSGPRRANNIPLPRYISSRSPILVSASFSRVSPQPKFLDLPDDSWQSREACEASFNRASRNLVTREYFFLFLSQS